MAAEHSTRSRNRNVQSVITISRSPEVIRDIKRRAAKNGFKRAPEFLLHCAETIDFAAHHKTSVLIGQMNRTLNDIRDFMVAGELPTPELIACIDQLTRDMRKLPVRLRKRG